MTLHIACCLRRLVLRPWPLVVILLLASEAFGQFTTVINIPPDEAPLLIGSDTQVNVFEEGAFPRHSQAGESDGSSTNVEFNVLGGSIGRDFKAHSGSTINIDGGTVGDSFQAFRGSTVNVTGGELGQHAEAYNGSVVNISGGSVGHIFDAFYGSTVNLFGGAIGYFFDAEQGSTINVFGGSIGDRTRARGGSTVNLAGGSTGNVFVAYDSSKVIISAGTIGENFRALAGSQIDVLGREFFLDGVPIGELANPGDSLVLKTREGRRLTGTLLDGKPFEFGLNTSFLPSGFFHPDATLRLTLAPEPSAWALTCLAFLACLLHRF